MLTLYEELFLLALDEEKGNFLPFTKKTISFGLSGAILAELALLRKICSNQKQRLEVIDANPTGDELLDEAIHVMNTSEKQRKLSYWITQSFDRPRKLRARIGENMAAKGLVLQDENRFYWPSPGKAEGGEEQTVLSKFELKIPLRAAIFSAQDANARELALLNTISGCGLLGLLFTEDEKPMAQRLVHQQVMHAALKDPALQTIEEIDDAIAASIEDEND